MVMYLLIFVQVGPEKFVRMQKGERCRNEKGNVLKEFRFPSKDLPDAVSAIKRCEKFCSSSANCSYCSIYCDTICQWNALFSCQEKESWRGLIEGDITVHPGTAYTDS